MNTTNTTAYRNLVARHLKLEQCYDAMSTQYRGALLENAKLQAQIDEMENLLFFYKTVDIQNRSNFGAV